MKRGYVFVNATKRQIDLLVAAITMQIALGALALKFNFSFHELEEVTKKAMVEIKSDIAEPEAADSEAS